MGSLSFITKSLHPLKFPFSGSHVVADCCATKTSFQSLLENALGKTRQFLRILCRKKNESSSDSIRLQHRLPVEYFPNSSGPTVPIKSKFVSYRPGYIHEVTSRWVSDSLVGAINKKTWRKLLQGGRGPMLCFVGFGLAKKPSLLKNEEEFEAVSFEIREAFSSVPWQSYKRETSVLDAFNKEFSLKELCIGNLIAKGCNAAVYSASLAKMTRTSSETIESRTKKVSSSSAAETEIPCTDKFYISHSEGEQNYLKLCADEKIDEQSFRNFNLAVKVMFNYSAESSAFAIWRAMHKEVLPAWTEFALDEIQWHKVKKKELKPHPNIVEMYCAFADQLPLLPGAFSNYPQALPVRLLSDGCGRNMTLFLVMKRYHCSLKDYLGKYDISSHTGLLLLTQLLEALVHLLQNDVVHRDLKADNILLDLSDGVASPKLVITDFGSSLEHLQLKYQSPEIEKGGNLALMAPEVVKAEAGQFSVIDYSRSDLWTAATLAYEIFDGSNPFYSISSSLKNFSYNEDALPDLPSKAPPVVQKLVKDMLHVNPKQRPSQTLAATVCQLLLHGPPDVSKCTSSKDFNQAVADWLFSFSAETYLEASLQGSEAIPNVELELKCTFCSRIQFMDVLNAVTYILDA